jgi:hypothetical protein
LPCPNCRIDKSVGEIEAEALHNITMRPASWERAAFDDLIVMGCTDDYLAAEWILDRAFWGKHIEI